MSWLPVKHRPIASSLAGAEGMVVFFRKHEMALILSFPAFYIPPTSTHHVHMLDVGQFACGGCYVAKQLGS